MQVWPRILVLLAVLAFGVSPITVSASPPDAFSVSAKLVHAGQSFAEPAAVVRADEPATIEVPGPNGYRLTLIVSDLGAGEIRVVADLDSSHGSMAPAMVVRSGQPAGVSIGDLSVELTVSRSGG